MAEELQRNAETGERLKRRRKALRLTQPQVAALAGVTPRAYQAWEAGGGIAWRHLEPLAEALGWTVEAIMGAEPEPDPSQLDRIERKLDELLDLARESDAAAVEEELNDAPLPGDERDASTG